MRFGLLFTLQVMGEGQTLRDPYRDMLDAAPVAEAAGYDSVFVASHHVQPDGWCPSPLLALSAVAAITERVRLGTGILLLPLYAPVKLAEDVAVLDQLSGGRVVLGVAPGYVSEEFAAHGVPRAERFERFEHGIDVLQELLGAHDPVRLAPPPLQRPHPPIWYGVSGPRSLRRAAARGCPLFASTRHETAELAGHYAIHAAAAAEHGTVIADRPVSRVVFVAETRAEAERIAAPGIEHVFRELYAAKSAQGERELRTTSGALVTDKGQALFGALRGRFVVGDPADAVAQLRALETELGATEIVCWMHLPGVSGEDALRSVRLFADAVMPAFA